MVFITTNYHGNTHTHTSDANQCTAVASGCGESQRLPIPPASCDWPAQDEIDIIGRNPVHSHYSAGSYNAVSRGWEGNRREE